MELIFRKPSETGNDKEMMDSFLILLKNDYLPPFSDEERKSELRDIYSGASNAILALTQQGQLAGYIVWKQYSKNERYGYIANLGVHPEFRRMGISAELRKQAFAQIEKVGYLGVYATTWHRNLRMIDASKKSGMRVVNVYPDETFRGPGGKTVLFKKDFYIGTASSLEN